MYEVSNSSSSDAQARALLLYLCDLLLEHRDPRPSLQLKHLQAPHTSHTTTPTALTTCITHQQSSTLTTPHNTTHSTSQQLTSD